MASGVSDMVQLRAIGGAVNDLDPTATAYAHRTQNFSLSASTRAARRAQIDAWWERLAPHLDGVYLSFETNQSAARIAEAFPHRDACQDRPPQRPSTTPRTCSTGTSASRPRSASVTMQA